ncbi:MAG TPA: acyl-CoA dehydrogenase family protein [Longimicrobium sp.]|nr:acyl-CoA dehydrogenase family protein [Longimicrobium sp.]
MEARLFLRGRHLASGSPGSITISRHLITMASDSSRRPAPFTDPDFYGWFSTLTEEENATRLKVRELMERVVVPVVNDHWQREEFPRELIGEIRKVDLLDRWYRDEPGPPPVARAVISLELARVDPGSASFFGVHAGLCMGSIALCGSDEQKEEWLPPLRRWERIGAFGLTEPEVGSATARGLTMRCRRDGDGWVLDGQKKWIGNATFADVVVIWARGEEPGAVHGFLVRTGNPGYAVEKITGKVAQRTVQSGLITLRGCRVPESDRLPGARTFADVARILRVGRAGVAWQAVGCAMGAYEHALAYALKRQQFGRPIAGFQLIQQKLVLMLGNITAMLGLALRVTRMQEDGTQRDEHSALAKQFCAAKCREVVALARDLMGGNGILLEHGAARLFADAEAIYSYEGTNEMNTLIVGRAITGHSAFV